MLFEAARRDPRLVRQMRQPGSLDNLNGPMLDMPPGRLANALLQAVGGFPRVQGVRSIRCPSARAASAPTSRAFPAWKALASCRACQALAACRAGSALRTTEPGIAASCRPP